MTLATESAPTPAAHHDTPHVSVAIVGSGFAGLGMAIRLVQQGDDDFVIFERANDVGGTWRDNSYPGCKCDVPSNLYSFSFAPNREWSQTYSPQPEIWEYLRGCAERFDITPRIRFDHTVLAARWDDEGQRWELKTSSGDWTADVVMLGNGPLSEPFIPKIEGLERFEGTLFHSARWDHEHDLAGERVAVIGTGASVIQFVPQIQPAVAQLHLFQRTPPWVMPHPDRPVAEWKKWLYRRFPLAQKAVRAGVYATRELFVLGLAGKRPQMMTKTRKMAVAHLQAQVPDPELRARLTPTYELGCKRLLISNDYYPAVGADNVELVTDGVVEVRPSSIVTADGCEREIDTIILGTGFQVTDNPIANIIQGRGGRTLRQAWEETGQLAYVGTTVAGFPNLFMLAGPNTGIGHTSLVFMIESQIACILDCLRTMRAGGVAAVEVSPEALRAYGAEVHDKMMTTVWMTGGCRSWYLDDKGRNSTLWPDFTWRYGLRTRRFDPEHYQLVPRRQEALVPRR